MLRPRRLLLSALVAGGALAATLVSPAEAALRIVGSTTVNPVVVEATERLAATEGLRATVDTLGGSSGGIRAVGEGRAEVGMSSRPLNAHDREAFPDRDLVAHVVGYDALGLVVSRDVWEGGVRSLSREEMAGIFEHRIRNWRAVGGPDEPIVFFDKEPGRGTWEVFVTWLYGGADAVPPVANREVGANEEARSKVAGTPGAIAPLSAAWTDGETTFALAIETAEGVVPPEGRALVDGSYPMVRPLLLVTDGPARGEAARLLEYLRGPAGQALVTKHGYLSLAAEGGGRAP